MNTLLLLAATLSLNGAWQLDYFPQPDTGAVRALPLPTGLAVKSVAATVPGNCELDLVHAGVLPEPEKGLNARAFRPYEGCQWLYTKVFEKPPIPDGGRALLVFEGVDTLSDYFLNGEKIGESENMFIDHRLDVTAKLREGTNVVQVLLRSVLLDSKTKTLGELGYTMAGGAEGEPYRKAGHMGGWDIFPRLFVSGLWRGVRLETQGAVRIDQTSWIVKSIDRAARRVELVGSCRIDMPFAALDKAEVTVSLGRDGKTAAQWKAPARHFQQSFGLTVNDAAFWWPRGMGEPALYDAKIEVRSADGRTLAAHTERIGLRTIELERDDVYGAERPGQFLFRVNGEPLYVRGSNWVPLDALHGRDGDRLLPTLEMFKDLNCNMIRVWGGGVYEPDAFFDWCDENGMLVWQDFMTGCSMFPFDPDYQRQTREEAIRVVLRLRNHPSLALWAGNNENDGAPRWRLGSSAAIRWNPTHDVTSRVTLPTVLREFDVTRPYLPSSPYFSPDVVAGKAKPSEDHLWGARAYYKVDFYTNSPCWFASEMGYHGCPNRDSLERMMTKDCVYPWTAVTGTDPWKDYHWNEEWQFKASDPWLCGGGSRRNSLMTNQVKIMFGGVPTDLDEFIEQSQFVQAEAMKTFCELFRSRKFTRSNGLIWWNVRDGWPQISDAVVDYYGGRKRAYFALRNAQRDQIVMVRDDRRAIAVNDTLAAVPGSVRITDAATGCEVLVRESFEIPANGTLDLGAVTWEGQGVLLIEATLGGKPFKNHFLYGEPPFDYKKVKSLLPGREGVRDDAEALLTGRTNPPGIIFDTDMVTDYDDVGAVACLHALADEGKCRILAMASCTRDNQSVAVVEILNAFYGRPDIPVGCAKGIGIVGVPEHDPERRGHEKFAQLAKEYAKWVKHPNSDDAPDANAVYRKALAAAPDGSVVFCSVGFLTNLRRLLETKADTISPLGGRDLVAKKVKALYAMGGVYPKGREYNVYNDAESGKVVFAEWPTPIYVSDFNLGRDVYSGRGVAERAYPFRNPVHNIFERCLPSRESTHSPGAWDREEGGHCSWDELTVLAAVAGAETHFKVERGGMVVADDGSNTWSVEANAGGALLLDEARGFTRRRLGEILDELIARPPARPWGR